MRKLSLLIVLIMISFQGMTQDLENEIGYLYTKAKYLLETNRTSEASELFTKIIKQDAHYKEAMALRADAKYRMGKNKKARKDIMRFIEQNGLTPNAVKTLALINYADRDYEAAANSLYTASLLFPRDLELLEKRAEVLFKNNKKSEACVAWHDAAKLGSRKAKTQIETNCYGGSSSVDIEVNTLPEYVPTQENETDIIIEVPSDVDKSNENESDKNTSDDNNTSGEDTTSEDNTPPVKEVEVEVEEEDLYDITDIDLKEGKNKWLKLDDELSVNILGGGLGDRKIKKMPNILLLTDEKGTIVVDLCIGKNGEVLAAEYNEKESTMKHRNNTEYLLRKTKDLKFDKFNMVKCGRIIYNVNE